MRSPVDLTRALKGGKWHGNYGTAKCPAHDDKSPSLGIRIGENGKTLVKCYAGCSQDAVIDALRRLNLWSGEPSNLRPFTPPPREDTNRNGEYGLKLWREAKPAGGTLVETYLQSRGITIPVPASLRFHPKLKHRDGGTWPAMVALVQHGVTGAPMAIHRTFLKPDGSGKAPVEKSKMMLGLCTGGAVRFAPAGPWLAVGEGIETCLSVQMASGKPTWSALSASGMKSLDFPPIVTEVLVLADADAAGEAAAVLAGRRWMDAGLVANIARPSEGNDFNELLMTGGAS